MAGKRGPAMLLCGAHENGTALDPDEIRAIRRLLSDAAAVYGASHAAEAKPTPLDQQAQPLRV
jgi:hypothetical protein